MKNHALNMDWGFHRRLLYINILHKKSIKPCIAFLKFCIKSNTDTRTRTYIHLYKL